MHDCAAEVRIGRKVFQKPTNFGEVKVDTHEPVVGTRLQDGSIQPTRYAFRSASEPFGKLVLADAKFPQPSLDLLRI
jgi:hypothetical protein